MRIIGMTLVRNEEDIIGQCLRYAAQQMDLILVVDCGSTDDSICEIEKVCEEFNHIVFLGKLGIKHPHEVRRNIWAKFCTHLRISDWWAYIDADEFPAENIRNIVKLAEQELADQVWSIHANFYYTESEAKAWYEGKETIADRSRPIWERRRFYRMHTQQPRLFKNLPWVRWNNDSHWPNNLSKPAHNRVIYRHYQYRDIPQIETRINTRNVGQFSQMLTKDDPHWCITQIHQAISKDNDSTLREYIEGCPFEEDLNLLPAIRQSCFKSTAKYIRSMLRSLEKQQASKHVFQ